MVGLTYLLKTKLHLLLLFVRTRFHQINQRSLITDIKPNYISCISSFYQHFRIIHYKCRWIQYKNKNVTRLELYFNIVFSVLYNK